MISLGEALASRGIRTNHDNSVVPFSTIPRGLCLSGTPRGKRRMNALEIAVLLTQSTSANRAKMDHTA